MSCLRCGKCCKKYYLEFATEADLQRWRKAKRQDIINSCSPIAHLYEMFISINGEGYAPEPDERYCRWYHAPTKKCRIHDVKPDICRNFICEQQQ